MRETCAACALALALACAQSATAAIVLFDQPVDIPGMISANNMGYICEPDYQRLADDFQLSTSANITTVQWNSSYRRFVVSPWTVGSTVSFRVEFYPFSGANLSTTPLVVYDLTATVSAIAGIGIQNRPVYEYNASIPAGLTLQGGTHYGISILETDGRTQGAEYLWSRPTPTNPSIAYVFVDGGWRPEVDTGSSAYAFQLRGEPVPCAPTLIALIAPLLLATNRRRPSAR